MNNKGKLSVVARRRFNARPALLLIFVSLLICTLVIPGVLADTTTLLSVNFDTGTDGFAYLDDPFNTNQPAYASGAHTTSAGYNGSGGLQVNLGGIDSNTINGMSGGWSYNLDLANLESGVVLSLRYRLSQSATYEFDEYSQVLVSLDGFQYGRGSKAYVDQIGGDGSSSQGNSSSYLPTTEWQQAQIFLGDLGPGPHTLILGASNNKKNASDESTTLILDEVVLTSGNPIPVASDAQTLVNRLDINQFKAYNQGVAQFHDRCRGSGMGCSSTDYSTNYYNALAWVESQLQAMGYTTVRHNFNYNGNTGTNLWATKMGSTNPTQMYMISTHLDGRGGGDAYDDDGSGVALVLEAARVFAASDVQTDKSIRFLFWDKEELGLYGSRGYVQDRRSLQGSLDEPTWLGLITHDMILYDHGAGSAGAEQSVYADLDVEWRAGTTKEADSKALAIAWRYYNGTYAPNYPANAYNYSTNTDDTPFHPYVASVSVRENRRSLTSGSNAEWINPYYHQTTDVESSYSTLDTLLGFNTVQTTVGTLAELAGVQILGPATPTATATDTPLPSDTPEPTATDTPLPTDTPGPTPTETLLPTDTPEPTVTDTPLPTNTPEPTDTPLPTATNTPVPAEVLYISSSSSGTAGGVSFADEDMLSYDIGMGIWSMYFDGSDVGVGGSDVDAFERLSDGSILVSFDTAFTISGFSSIDDSDILRFIPSSTGSSTSGTWEWYFDGSDVGLSTSNEDIDAFTLLPDGRLLISTVGSVSVSGASGADEDLLQFTPTQLGSTTRGTWSMYFDGSDVGLSTSSNEDVNGVWLDPISGKIYLTTLGSFSVSGVSGDGSDIFVCTPSSLGSSTACAFAMYWDGSANGFSGEVSDALGIVR